MRTNEPANTARLSNLGIQEYLKAPPNGVEFRDVSFTTGLDFTKSMSPVAEEKVKTLQRRVLGGVSAAA